MPKKFASVLLVVLIFLAVLAGLSYYWFVYKTDKVSAPSSSNSVISPKIEEQKITDGTKPFKIDITYPQVSGLDDLNQTIKDVIDQEVTEFKKYSLENDEAVKKIDPESYTKYPREYDLNINYAEGELDGSTASVMLDIYSFVGGAHGSQTFIPFNYDIKNKKFLKLADLFEGQPDYLQKISDYCSKDLTDQIKKRMEEYAADVDTNWIKQGTEPKEENYSRFLINKDSVVIYFQEYQVAAYAFGSFKVTMPR